MALFAELARTGLASLLFLLLARQLGPDSFGIVASVSAWVAIFGPLVALSAPYRILTQSKKSDKARPIRLARTHFKSTAVAALPVALVLSVLNNSGSSVGYATLAALTISELLMLLYALIFNAAASASRDGSLLLLAACRVMVPRFVGCASTFVALPWNRIESYALFALLATLVVVLLEVRYVPWKLFDYGIFTSPREGAGYSISGLLSRANDDLDKVVLSHTAISSLGTYSVIYRLVFFSLIPGRALLASSIGDWYNQRGQKVSASVTRVALIGGLMAAVSVATLFLSWPLINQLALDNQYTVPGILFLLLGGAAVMRVGVYAVGELLLASGLHARRTSVQAVGLAVNLALLVTLTQSDALLGAALATVISEGLILVGSIMACACRRRRV